MEQLERQALTVPLEPLVCKERLDRQEPLGPLAPQACSAQLERLELLVCLEQLAPLVLKEPRA